MKQCFQSVSLSTLCFAIAAFGNVALMCATVYRVLSPKAEPVYTYTDFDTPLAIPEGLPVVEMTFQESAHFTLSDEFNKPSWATLFGKRSGVGFIHIGPFHHRAVNAARHSRHCVYNMDLDLDRPRNGHLSEHYNHCLWYLRQVFLCNADTTLEDGDFLKKNYTLDRMGSTRECKDWSAAEAWTTRNFLEWAEFNGVFYNTTDSEV
ncbi:hypothetical protein BXZ70DRAFT_1007390 [Cristinia sonorae]|uniref:Oxidase ustYa n=1 Tax=Cristinia sonorae TaxID=1940300 RepID=A0A8K0UR70_9AGAR|nr:hypothetical protein BXZ70DRAFT_1007390 [Cristinia sonorae]